MESRALSAGYIHIKSQDVSNGNLTNSKIQRLLRGAYAVSYSVGPCEFLYWALSEPPFGTAWGSRFFILTDRDMARIQVAMAVTIDGFLPDKDHTLAEWVRTSSNGFPRWRDACSYPLFPKYPLLDLICDKGHSDDAFTYYAEIMDKESTELCRGLFLYHMVDELILYLLPLTTSRGIHVMRHVSPGHWKLHGIRHYNNGVCRMIYRKA